MKRIVLGMGRALGLIARGLGAAGRATIALVGICGVVAALANYTMTQGVGTNFGSIVVGGVHYAQMMICDLTTPAQCGAVNASGSQQMDWTTGSQAHADMTASLPAGPNIIGKMGIDQTTPGTTNGVQVNAALPVGNNTLGSVKQTDGTTVVLTDPCQGVTPTYTPINIGSATTTRIIAPTSAKKTYICSIDLFAVAADNVAIVEGTGGTCGTGTAGVVGGTTTGTGISFPTQGGLAKGNGVASVWATAGTNVDFCLITSTSGPLTGHVKWVQQ